MRCAVLLVLALFATACSEGVELPLEVSATDLVVVVSTVDGRGAATVVRPEAGRAIAVDADPDTPIFTWVLAAEDQVDPSGAAVSEDVLAQTIARFVEDPIDVDEGRGQCERCAAPTLAAPMVVHPGDACPLPTFVRGAVWRPEGGEYTCRGATGARLCAEGSVLDDEAIEATRRRLRLDRPGACSCDAVEPPMSLSGLRISPIAPADNPLPLVAFAQNAAGQVAGFSRSGTLLWDPADPEPRARPLEEFAVSVKSAIGLRSGDFLVTGEIFNSGALDAQGYFRFTPSDAGLSEPVLVRPSAPVLAQRMRYLGAPGNEFPLYLIGGIRGAYGVEPAVFACTEARLACQQVNFTDCTAEQPDFRRIEDAAITEAGFGLAVAKNALYYKAPNPAGAPDPSPDDDWRCAQPLGPMPGVTPEDPTVSLRSFGTIGRAGDRLFVCGQEQVPACQSTRAIVMTATAGAADPEWRVTYRGSSNTYCGSWLPRPDGIAVSISGARLVEFDADGAVRETPSVFDRYGSLDGFLGIDPLLGDMVISRGTENRVFVATSSEAFTPIYGPAARTRRIYWSSVARPGGGFVVFGETPGPVFVDALDGAVREAADPEDALSGARIFAAVALGGSADDVTVVLGGDRGGEPYLIRGRVTPAGLVDVRPVTLPSEVASVRHLSVMLDRVLVGTLGTRLFDLAGDTATEIPVAWDDPLTESVERRPMDPVDGCSGNPRRLDLWRNTFSADGAGWAVGARGLAFQVSPSHDGGRRAERLPMPETTLVTAGVGRCASQAWVAGRGEIVSPAGIDTISLRLFGLETVDEPRRGELPDDPLDPRRQRLGPTAVSEIETVNVLDIVFGIPTAVLRDTDGRDETPTVVLDNGFLYRVAAGTRLEYLRVPFRPETTSQDETGRVLFAGGDARIAVGLPP